MGGSNSKPGAPRMKAVYNGSMQSLISGGGLTAYRQTRVYNDAYAVINNAAQGGSIGAAARAMGRGNCAGFPHCPK
jgi:hypothetical protein